MDVMAEGDADLTPYRFGYNNPVLFSDPTGLWEEVDGGHKTTDKDEIQRIYAFLQSNQNASMEQISSFVKEDIAFMSQYNDGMPLTGLTVVGGKVNEGTLLRTKNEIAYYMGNTNYLYNRADFRKRDLILGHGTNDPISRLLLSREEAGEYKPINAANGIKYRGGQDSARMMNFMAFFELMPGMDAPNVKGLNTKGRLSNTLPSIKMRLAKRLGINEAAIDEIRNSTTSYHQFEKAYKHMYIGKFKGRGTWRTHMGMDFRLLKNL